MVSKLRMLLDPEIKAMGLLILGDSALVLNFFYRWLFGGGLSVGLVMLTVIGLAGLAFIVRQIAVGGSVNYRTVLNEKVAIVTGLAFVFCVWFVCFVFVFCFLL